MNAFSFAAGEDQLRLSTGDGLRLSDSLLLSVLSALAYDDQNAVAAALPHLGFRLLAFFDRGETQGFAAASDTALVVSFRGTSQRADWVTNLKTRRTRTALGKVHRGFLAALDQVWSEVEAVIQKERGSRALWLTGHSLGGALAALAAARCAVERNWPVSGLHTFGQPRVGNRTFAANLERSLTNRYFRFTNNQDSVPGIPSSWFYRHAGQMLWFDKRGSVVQPVGMEGWGIYWVRTAAFSWEMRGGTLFQVQKSYRDGKWQSDVDTIGDHSIGTCRDLLRRALLSGLEPTRITVKAARLLREGRES